MVYVKIIQDDDVKMSAKCIVGETKYFMVKMLRKF